MLVKAVYYTLEVVLFFLSAVMYFLTILLQIFTAIIVWDGLVVNFSELPEIQPIAWAGIIILANVFRYWFQTEDTADEISDGFWETSDEEEEDDETEAETEGWSWHCLNIAKVRSVVLISNTVTFFIALLLVSIIYQLIGAPPAPM